MNIDTPLDNGKIHFKSRIVFPLMATQASENGVPGVEMVRHYAAIAENQAVGLIITEHSYIDRQGKADPFQVSFASDTVIDVQKAMTDRLHTMNPEIKLMAQINHAGAATSEEVTGEQLVSASDIRMGSEAARALAKEEIHQIEKKFAAAAVRVKEAGYDGVEIHSAHGYLLNQFYSPLTNFRTDEYGAQDIDNRTRFLSETLEEVRKAVGQDFPVAVRLGGSDYIEGGSTISDAVAAALILEEKGADLIDLSGGMCGFTRRDDRSPGWFSDMSKAVKAKIHIPVLVTGGITQPVQAGKLLEEGCADLVGVGRAMFRNPRWGK